MKRWDNVHCNNTQIGERAEYPVGFVPSNSRNLSVGSLFVMCWEKVAQSSACVGLAFADAKPTS
jgi:hypothetical protein